MRRRLLSVAAAMTVSMVSACATLPEDPEERAEALAVNDPVEPANRAIYDVNMFFDSNLAEPVAQTYRDVAPDWLRQAIHNLLANMQEPYTAGNDLLQGNPAAAADALGRFFINSTFGLLGTQDVVAESGGARRHSTDLGITLAVWGVDEGPYLMLPFFGPSNLRDGSARVADYFADPMGRVFSGRGLGVINDVNTGVDVLDTRTEHLDTLKEIKRTSIDEYAAIRSLYRQFRTGAVNASLNGQKDTRAPVPGQAATAPTPAATTTDAAPAAAAEGQAGIAPKADTVKPSAVEFVEPKK
ncbi:VacJ-like lipoprotein [Paramagnetospirillum magnetotacticum MS-1]|uniref:VacJ-like lipoprotein n=1 Tax=Paramagnetospirillum magnetotacticum MS-1 TaxID=272627 RepID=A0A0C2YJQ8_PARME|nr:VacJ family lipoprotein [Paramagnetospirillum magnetotacticum]KIM00005.1 VacJ-like lipoprotein [Paramagnetospirillum magnetotacticum MS-1]